jgi:hypothetical protein
MTAKYWLLYDVANIDPAGPYSDIHKCRDHAVGDASDIGCRVQIHKGDINFCEWDGGTLVEEW